MFQVICTKCNQSKDDNLAPTCRCGGGYRTSVNRAETKTRLRMIKSGEYRAAARRDCHADRGLVADYHGLPLVNEYVTQTLARW